jgi:hypothetical protein
MGMREWGFAQTDPAQELALIHFFSVKKHQAGGEVEFRITVKEYVTPKEPTMHFFAQADKEINQKHAPFKPVGWGKTMLDALAECIRSINKFPYEEPESVSTGA